MIANYVKTSLRKFRRAKLHTLINVVGLTLGLLCAVIIFQKVRFEYSFDRETPGADRIFRIVHESTQFDRLSYTDGVPYPLLEAFRQDFPEAERVTITDRNFGAVVIAVERADGQVARFKEEAGIAFVDPEYFDIFVRRWVKGDPATAFNAPRSVVLSESLVRKYFGDEEPMGRLLTFDNEFDLTVTGIVADAPPNTMVRLDMLITFDLGEEHYRGNDNWGSVASSVQAWVKLPPGMPAGRLNEGFRDFVTRYWDEEDAPHLTYFLQPLPEIHFDERFNAIGEQQIVARETLWALALVGFFLLLTACINFINLNTVLVFRRAKEVAVRKVMGGTPRQIVAYFMTETALVTGLAVGLALALANPLIALSRSFIGEGFSANPFADPVLAAFALLAGLLLTVFSGLYPAFLLSRLSPTLAMRGTADRKPGAFLTLRRGLVVVQFAITQVLIICTLTAMVQMQHLYDVPLGYNPEAIVEFDIPERDETKLETLAAQMRRAGPVQAVTYSNSGASSDNTWNANFYYEKGDERLQNNTQVKLIEPGYVDTYQMKLVAGEGFVPSDTIASVLVNEAFVRRMGYETPHEALGTPISSWMARGVPVVGVVQDFNTNSLHREINPVLLIPTTDYAYVGAARVNTAQLEEALAAIEAAWTEAFPDYLFEYVFLDERIARFYENEQTLQRLIQAFALVAILIGCIGLFGLISYTTSQRAKEVGIRKVLGASASSIVGLFTREFVVMVTLGFGLAAPLAYYVMRQWLENFAYRIDLGAGLFALAFLVSLVLALLTVAFRTYRAAAANPVDAIRQE